MRRPLTRREVLQRATAGSVVVGSSGFLSACFGGDDDDSTKSGTPAETGKPRRGGTLTVALTGGTSAATLDPINPVTQPDEARTHALYDSLVVRSPEAHPQLQLAEEITPNKDATEWTIRLKRGVEFHDGREMTAKDVIYTFRKILDPKAPAVAATGLSRIDAAALKALDKYTVRVPLKQAYSIFVEQLSGNAQPVIPDGFNPKKDKPNGTGPFKFQSFTPGRESVFVRHPNYWTDGQPYADKLVITDFEDEASAVNALLAGQVNISGGITSDSLQSIQSSGKKVLISPGGGFTMFTMHVQKPPFDDVNVRQALRMVVDRKQMRDAVFAGHGAIGNDVYGIWSEDYDHSLPQREQDFEQAKSLLAKAGKSNLSVELITAEVQQGAVKSAQVLAEQAKGAGIDIKLRKITATELYGDNYLKWPFAQDYSTYNYYLPEIALVGVKGAPYNETGWDDPTYTRLYNEALGTADEAKRTELAHELQRIDYDRGSYIIPLFTPIIDGYAEEVHGLKPSKAGISVNAFQFAPIWLA
jgi:peptide/nickel transport system substrate-binding protein